MKKSSFNDFNKFYDNVIKNKNSKNKEQFLFDNGNVRTEGDDSDPALTIRSRSAASVDCADPVENRTFFTKSKILEKEVKQVQGDGREEVFGAGSINEHKK